MSRKIVIPWKINERLERLAQLQQETNGALLYVPEKRPFGFNYNVRALYMTGVGTAHNVQADPRRMEIVNIFFEKHPGYGFVKWHTHCRETGEQWYEKFSQGDINSYKWQLRQDRRFVGMMISPTRKQLYGYGDLGFATIRSPTSDLLEDRISDELRHIAEQLGYVNLPPLLATERR